MLGFPLYVPESFTTQLQNFFAEVSDNYTFCFHSINRSPVFPNPSFVKGQMMFFSQNYSNNIKLKDIPVKYTSGCNVIFHSLDIPKSLPFLFTYFLFYIGLVWVYLSSRFYFVHDTLSFTELNMLLLKFVVYPGPIGDLNFQLFCNTYCKKHSATFQKSSVSKTLVNPIGTQKSYLWNANQKVIQSSVFVKFWYYLEPEVYGRDQYAYARLVMKSILTSNIVHTTSWDLLLLRKFALSQLYHIQS